MATIDERVVKMRFDNAGFKGGISETISLLDRFKSKLNLKGASQGIDDVQSSVNRFNLNPLTAGVNSAQNSFNALRAVAFGAFASIGAKAAETGTQLVHTLTLKPAMEGFQEYELKMGSIQTILANTQSKGTTLDDVKSSLSELNTYADKTIYNFGDMTRNIGLFTNAGLGIEESTSMIKGFSNAAAASGTNATAAAGAAYQLSQGLSSGYLTAMDWMSLTNAGMGNKNMQQDLISIADAMGTFENGSSSAEEATKDFKNTLADGQWLTKDVMSTYLQAMAGDLDEAALKAKGLSDETIKSIMQNAKTGEEAATKIRTLSQLTGTIQEEIGSGWTDTWELIFGDFEEATDLFSGIHDAIAPAIDASSKFRNEILKSFADIGGRKALFDGIGESFKFLGDLLKPIGQAFSEVFGRGRDAADFARQLKSLSVTFRDFAKGLSVSSETADKIKRTFKGLFAVFSIAGQIIGAVVKAIFGLVGATAGASGGFLSITASIGDFLVKIDEGLRSSNILNSVLGGLGSVLKIVASAFGVVGNAIGNFITGGEDGVNVFTRLKDAASSVLDFLSGFSERVNDALQNGSQNLGKLPWAKILGVGSLVGIFAYIRKIMKNGLDVNVATGVFDSLKETLGAAKESFEGVSGIFDSVTESLDTMQQSLKADILLKIAAAVGILALSLVALANVPAGDLAKAAAAIAVLTAELTGAMFVLTKINPKNVMTVQSLAGAMIAVATAVLILASAVKKLSELSWGELIKGLAGVAASMGILAGGLRLMPDKSSMIRMGTGLILVATALNVMVSAVRSMSDMSWGEMIQGLAGVGGALVILAGGLRLMPKEQMMSTGAGLILVGAGLKVIASAVQSFGSMDLSTLVQGVLGVGGALAVLAGTLRLMPNNMMATGAGLVVVGAGLQVISGAVSKLGSLDTMSLVKGLAGIGGSLVIIAGAMQIMPKNMVVTAAGLIMVASALTTISQAVISMGGMSWGEIAKGLVALGGSLAILAAGLYAMSGALAGAAALTVASVGISMLASAVMMLSTLDLGGIFTALGALGGAIAVVAVAALALSPAVPAMFGLGAALALIGASVMAAGAGMALFASSLSLLAGPASAGIQVLQKMFELIPELLKALAEGITEFIVTLGANAEKIIGAVGSLISKLLTSVLDIIITAAPKIGEALVSIGKTLLQTIIDLTPKIVEAVVTLLKELLQGIQTIAPQFVETFVTIARSVLDAIVQVVPEIGEALTAIVKTFLETISQAIVTLVEKILEGVRTIAPQITETFVTIAQSILDAINRVVPQIAETFVTIAKSILDAINQVVPQIGETFTTIITTFLQTINTTAPQIVQAIVNLVTDMLQGIQSMVSKFAETFVAIMHAILGAINQVAPEVIDSIVNLVFKLVDTIVAAVPRFVSAAIQLVQGLLDGIASQVGGVIQSAVNLVLSFAEGISSQIPVVVDRGYKMVIDLLHGIASAIRNNSSEVGAAGADLGMAIIQGMANAIRSGVSTVIRAAADMAGSALRAAKNKLGIHSPSREFYKVGDYSVQGLAKGIKDNTGTAVKSVKTMSGKLLNAAADGLKGFGNAVTGHAPTVADEFGKMTDSIVSDTERIKNATGEFKDAISGDMKAASGVASLPTEKRGRFSLHQVLDTMNSVTSVISDGLTLYDKAADVFGLTKLDGSQGGNSADINYDNANPTINADSTVRQAEGVGENITKGVDRGAKRGWPAVVENFQRGSQDLLNRFKEFFGIHSPSRVMMKMGGYIVEGLKDGISKEEKSLRSSAGDMSKVVFDTFDDIDGRIAKSPFANSPVSDFFDDMSGRAKFLDGQASGFLDDLSDRAKFFVGETSGFFDDITGKAKFFERKTSDVFGYISDKAKSLENQAYGFLEDRLKDISVRAKALKNQTYGFLDDVARKIKSLDGRASGFVDEFFDNVSGRVKSLKAQTYDFFDDLSDSAKSLEDQVVGLFYSVSDKSQLFKSQVLDFFESIPGRVRSFGREVNDILTDFERDMTAHIDNLKSTILNLPSPSQVATEMRDSVIRGLRFGIVREENALLSSVDSMTNVIFSALDDVEARLENSPLAGTPVAGFFHDFSTQTKSFMKDIPGAISSVADKLNGGVDGLDKVFNKIVDSTRALDPIHSRIVKGLDQGLTHAQKSLSISVGSMSKTISDAFNVVEKRIEASPLSHPPVDGFFDGISDQAKFFAGEVPGTLTSIANQIGDKNSIWGPAFFGLESAMGVAHGHAKGTVVEIENAYRELFNVDEVFDGIKADIDYISSPVIKPVMDLSQVNELNDIFGSASNVRSGALATMSRFNKTKASINESIANAAQPIIRFTQNNHSPKALSLDDIYRKTNNQLNFFKLRGGGFNP